MQLNGVTQALSRVGEIQADISAAVSFSSVLENAQTQVAAASKSALPSSPSFGTPVARAGVQAVAPTGPVGNWAARLPEVGRKWAPAIERAAREAGVDPRLLASLVWAESAFNPGAVSGAGATGLTQLMPGTAAGLGVDPRDPVQNLNGGARYLAQQLKSFGSPALALAAYNAGPGNVQKYGGIPPFSETQGYVQRVLGYYKQLGGA
ncbi:MAG: lytic transglycosylase domain-containing protein [Actinomycetota bacterium]